MAGEYYLPSRRDYDDPALLEQEAARATRRALMLLVGWFLLILYCAAVIFDWWPWLRGWGSPPQGRTWGTYTVQMARLFPVIAIVAAGWAVVTVADFAYLIPLWSAGRRARNGTVIAVYLLSMIILGYGLQLALLGLKADNANRVLVERLSKSTEAGFFGLAAGANGISTFFSDYPNHLDDVACAACAGQPPGAGLFYWLGIQVAGDLPIQTQRNLSAAVWPLLGGSSAADLRSQLSDVQLLGAFIAGSTLLLLAAATVVPAFALARMLAPRGYAFKLSALALVIPGLMLFAPAFDPAFAFLSATALYLGVRGMLAEDGLAGSVWSLCAGLCIAIGLYFSLVFATLFLALVLLGVIGFAGGRHTLQQADHSEARMQLGDFLSWLTGLIIGVFGSLGMVALVTNSHLLYIFTYNLKTLAATEAARPYLPWLVHGPLDFMQFLGLPLAVAVLMVFIRRGRRADTGYSQSGSGYYDINEASRAPAWYARLNAYSLTLVLVVVAVAITGASKTEEGRTLMLLSPLAIAAIALWAERDHPRPIYLTQLYGAQLLVLICIAARWLLA